MFVHYYDAISEGKISTSNIIEYKQEPLEVTIQIERQSAESPTHTCETLLLASSKSLMCHPSRQGLL